ncbi:hypothetical protein BCR33DRAFT_796350 [Rhizoclosmatium globosum]|uniref:Uncharacterized protein n=1 Tax=Rhizoclosmatium globosum TaxID=329046 RepID=A0A1Y2AMC9_9FUNG|nr:hypothetical protein BCR33DRAFT_796350 [Rhizoclosmatium globosum]|eukprot:ORY23644.1 hypothetical protein BCR33DRAFT_796350 [Rhizoclosmatium globosum]
MEYYKNAQTRLDSTQFVSSEQVKFSYLVHCALWLDYIGLGHKAKERSCNDEFQYAQARSGVSAATYSELVGMVLKMFQHETLWITSFNGSNYEEMSKQFIVLWNGWSQGEAPVLTVCREMLNILESAVKEGKSVSEIQQVYQEARKKRKKQVEESHARKSSRTRLSLFQTLLAKFDCLEGIADVSEFFEWVGESGKLKELTVLYLKSLDEDIHESEDEDAEEH